MADNDDKGQSQSNVGSDLVNGESGDDIIAMAYEPGLDGSPKRRKSFLPGPKNFGATSTNPSTVAAPQQGKGGVTHYTKPGAEEVLYVGQRVFIGGIKLGTVLYYGRTHIADGVWCGIELDDPDGRHDGQVEGVRYFRCRAGHGIFAPLEKVTKASFSDTVQSSSEEDQQHPHQRLQRRLLPQPKSFSRTGSRETILIHSKIEEQNEDVEEESKDKNADLKINVSPKHRAQVQEREELITKRFSDTFTKEDLTKKLGDTFTKEDLTKRLGDTFTKEDLAEIIGLSPKSSPRESPRSSPKRSRLPTAGSSRLPQQLRSDVEIERRRLTEVDHKKREPQPSVEGKLSGSDLNRTYVISDKQGIGGVSKSEAAIPSSQEISELRKTYVLDDKLQGAVDNDEAGEVNAVGSDDSLSSDAQECLSSDNRQYLNFTFDTESRSNEGSPQHGATKVGGGSEQQTFVLPQQPLLNQTDTISDSSLGVLDVDKSSFDSNLLEGISSIITGSEKLVKQTPRKDTILSLGSISDSFSEAISSTPTANFKQEEISVYPQSVSEIPEALRVDKPQEVPILSKSLNSTFKIEHKEFVPPVSTDDTLDWRQEASDGENEEYAESGENVEEKEQSRQSDILPTQVVIENVRNKSVTTTDKDGRELLISETGGVVESDLIKSTGSDIEQLFHRIKKPMTDSGVSDLGDILHLEQGRMADSCELRRSQNLESVAELMEQNITENEDLPSSNVQSYSSLMSDLAAGHSKQGRPLSLISTTSADTGYVPDTDSEVETVTEISPPSWAEKQGLAANTSISELDKAYTNTFKHFQAAVTRGTRRALDPDSSDSDVYSEAGTIIADTDTLQGSSGILDLENMSDMLIDMEGLEPQDLLPLPLEEEATKLQGPTIDKVKTPTNPDADEEEDERIEADQQQDSSEVKDTEVAAMETGGDKSEDVTDSVVVNEIVDQVSVSVDTVVTESVDNAPQVDSTKSEEGVIPPESLQNDQEQSTEESDKASVNKNEKGKSKENNRGRALRKKKEVEKVEHKKPNTKVVSRLADYINAPLPVKVKEEPKETPKPKANVKKNVIKAVEENDKSKQNDENEKNLKKKVEKEPPKIIKRTTPKSKWGNIMSQIEENQTKPKPKKEVKSMLQAYLSTPVPPKEKKAEPKPKKIIPKPDYSKVKSKLNLAPASTPTKRDVSPHPGQSDKPSSRRQSSVTSGTSATHALPRLDFNDSCGSSVLGSGISSVRSSHSDINAAVEGEKTETDGESNTPRAAKPENRNVTMVRRDRKDSISSNVSDTSQGSVKAMNAKNLKLSESAQQRRKSMPARSSIPPPVNSPKARSPARSASGSRTPLKTNTAETNKTPTSTNKSTPSTSSSKPLKSPTKPNASAKHKSSARKNNNQNRNKTSKKEKNHVKVTKEAEPAPVISSQAKEEIARLEALCEARTKELNFAKLQMKSNLQAFDAMAALVNYLSNDLDAFSCPMLAQKLQALQHQMADTKSKLDELQEHKTKLEQELSEARQEHERHTTNIKEQHEQSMEEQKDTMNKDKQEAVKKMEDYYSDEMKRLKNYQDKQLRELDADHKEAVNRLQQQRLEEIRSLQKKQDEQMEELHKQHRDKLEDITHRFESMKMSLSDKVNTLRYECEDLKVRARISEEALQKDSDYKVQMALAPFRNLPQEIESLKLVIEMRNEEIQKLRMKNHQLEKQLEDFSYTKEKLASLQQKLENTEAICTLKSDHEKQLHEKCQVLMRKFDRESKANKRLSMDYEELMWKMNQSAELGSQENLWKLGGQSPTPSDSGSPALRRKNQSPSISETERMSARSPVYRRSLSGNPSGDSPVDKRLKRRSATYIIEDRRTSPTGSPLHKRPHGSSSSPSHQITQSYHSYVDGELSNGKTDRMAHSLNDMDVFDGPQALPSPPLPLSGSSSSSASITMSTSSSGGSHPVSPDHCTHKAPETSEVISRDQVRSERSEADGCAEPAHSLPKKSSPDLPYADQDKEQVTDISHDEGLCIAEEQSDVRDDASDMSHSTESNVLSNTSSLYWDYEKMDSSKSMDSSQASDTLLEQNGALDSWQSDNSVMTTSKDMSSSSSTETVVTPRTLDHNEGQTTQENIPQSDTSLKCVKVSTV